jgi:hypothetical protein
MSFAAVLEEFKEETKEISMNPNIDDAEKQKLSKETFQSFAPQIEEIALKAQKEFNYN